MLQWCGVDSTNDTVQSAENIKCASDKSGAYYPSTYLTYPHSGEYAPRLGIGTYTQWGSTDGTSSKSPNSDYVTQHFTMSGGPPQHPHARQAPPNSAWNHLQVPNYYPSGQPQHAHMSNELPMLAHQPTWHTPTTTEPAKGLSHSPLFNLQQMLGSERPYPRHSPGVDLTLTRNGSQNGDLPQTPISLSVRDTKQINSLPVGAALDGDRAVELTKATNERPKSADSSSIPSDLAKGLRELTKATELAKELKANQPTDLIKTQDCQPSPKNIRRPTKRVDSIVERLNTTNEKLTSVIVTAASSSHDENSNSSQGTAIHSAPTPTPVRDEEVVSPVSNEDSLDSNKSRRKRKPNKTMKVAKEDDFVNPEPDKPLSTVVENAILNVPMAVKDVLPQAPVVQTLPVPEATKVSPARRRSSSEPPSSPPSTSKSRRKTVSESETIDNIAAMVAATSREEVQLVSAPLPHNLLSRNPLETPLEKTLAEVSYPPKSSPEKLPSPEKPCPESCPENPYLPEKTHEKTASEKSFDNIPIAKPVSVITSREHSNCSSDSLTPLKPVEIIPCADELAEKEDPLEGAAAPQLVTLAQKKAGDTQCFVAVEDELEKMFAGIADSGNGPGSDPLAIASTSGLDNVTSTSNDMAGTSKGCHKRGRPKGSKNTSRRPSESNSTESTPRKKHKENKKRDEVEESPSKSTGVKTPTKAKVKKGKKQQLAPSKLQLNNKPDVVKDVYSYDSGSNASSSRSKGPFIQIRGPRDSPISVSIVNTPSNEDDPDKPKQLKNKKFHDDSEYRHKVRSKGLHCSTLSNKYDAQTRDATWICVFCKRGPHATDPQLPGPSPFTLDLPQYSPGDLFGPYIITTDCPEYQRRNDDPFDAQFKSKRSAANMTSEVLKKKSKKRQNSESSLRDSVESGAGSELSKDVMFGIAEVSGSQHEVWVHEDCVIWAPGVYLVGPKIVGLEGAVWGACAVACRRCGLRGAAVCCLKRGCSSVMHIGCAKLSKWKLDEDHYKAFCTEHAPP